MGNKLIKSNKERIINTTLINNRIFCTKCNKFHNPFLKYCIYCERCNKIYNFHCHKCNRCYNTFNYDKCDNCYTEKTYYCETCKIENIKDIDLHYCRKHSF